MALPFTVEQFYGVFRDYNAAVWPAQWFLVALALVAVGAVLRPQPWSGAVVFIWQGVVRRRLSFRWVPGLNAMAGVVLIAFALVVYPVWSAYAGHPYPATPTFGLPCPTTIFTIGLLCFAVPPMPRSPLIVPLLWCLVGAQAAFLLGVQPDLGLIAAAVVGVGLLATAGQRHRALKP
jgi:hypothetical protein